VSLSTEEKFMMAMVGPAEIIPVDVALVDVAFVDVEPGIDPVTVEPEVTPGTGPGLGPVVGAGAVGRVGNNGSPAGFRTEGTDKPMALAMPTDAITNTGWIGGDALPADDGVDTLNRASMAAINFHHHVQNWSIIALHSLACGECRHPSRLSAI